MHSWEGLPVGSIDRCRDGENAGAVRINECVGVVSGGAEVLQEPDLAAIGRPGAHSLVVAAIAGDINSAGPIRIDHLDVARADVAGQVVLRERDLLTVWRPRRVRCGSVATAADVVRELGDAGPIGLHDIDVVPVPVESDLRAVG
jgi:hypothetical protein